MIALPTWAPVSLYPYFPGGWGVDRRKEIQGDGYKNGVVEEQIKNGLDMWPKE